MKEIIKGIFIADLALYLDNYKTLILADPHIGFEESLNKQGIFVPRFHFNDLIKRLEKIFAELKKENKILELIIINGDLKHEFGSISEQEWRHSLKLIDFLSQHAEKIIIAKGNHDKILNPIIETSETATRNLPVLARSKGAVSECAQEHAPRFSAAVLDKRDIEICDEVLIDDILIIHGDKVPKSLDKNKKIKTIIIGHEHPAVSIRENAKSEVFKCFLLGRWKNKNLIAQPSLNLVTEGTDILREKMISPFLKETNLSNFEFFIIADKVYGFGKIKNIQKV